MAVDQMIFENSLGPIPSEEAAQRSHNCPPLFRYLRLQLLPQLTRWNTRLEPSKIALHKNRKIAFFSLLLHAVPLTAVFTLIILNARVTYVGTVNNTMIGVLQLVAKSLEILMQASLGNILLNVTRNELLGAAPYPLGGLLAPYRVTDITFLWSLEFWGAATSACFRPAKKTAFVASISMIIIIAATAGPANAVAMIPRLLDLPVTESIVITSTDDLQVLYPGTMRLNSSQMNNEHAINNSIHQFREVADVPLSPITDNAGIRDLHWWTLAHVNSGAAKHLRDYTSSEAATLATQAASYALGTSMLLEGNMGHLSALQPYVVSQCHATSVNNSQAALQDFVTFDTDDLNLDSIVRYADVMQNVTYGTTSSGLNLIAMSDIVSQTSLSLTDVGEVSHKHSFASISSSYSESGNLMHGSADTFSNLGGWDVFACIYSATWEMAETNLSSKTMIVSSGDFGDEHSSQPGLSIKIDLNWARRLVDLIVGDQSNPDYYNLSFFLVSPLALAIADAATLDPRNYESFGTYFGDYTTPQNRSRLSSEQYHNVLELIKNEKLLDRYSRVTIWDHATNWTDPSTLQRFIIRNSNYGYGYDTSGSIVRLALAVLCCYVALVMVYLVYIMITGHTATSWDSVGELFMLALNSRQPGHIQGTSVGVETLSTYQKPTNIRVNRKNSWAELILEDDPSINIDDYRKVQPNASYW